MKVIGYVRVSTESQAREGVSIEAQKAKIAQWCELNDAELVAIYEDAGLSGATMKREGLAQAIKATGKGYVMCCYSISRIARSTKDMLTIADTLDKKGADLVSITEKIETNTASGRMVFRMLSVLQEYEREQVGERTAMALRHKKNTNKVYGPTPMGFQRCGSDLVADEAEAQVVGYIVQQRQRGETFANIANTMNARGIVGKRGGKWFPSTVRYIVQRQLSA